AYAVAELHLIVASHPLCRTTVDSEDGRVSLLKWQDHRAGLHAGALFRHHEFAAMEVYPWLVQHHRDLYRGDMLPLQDAMQAVVVLRYIPEEQRCRMGLAGLMTARKKRRVLGRKPHFIAHPLVPLVGNRCQVGIGRRSQRLNQRRERVAEVFVLAAAEAM